MLRTTALLSTSFCCLWLFGAQDAFADAGQKKDGSVFSADSKIIETPRSVPVKPPESVEEAIGAGKEIVAAAKAGHWALMIGLIVMVITSLINRVFRSKIPAAVLPWLATALGLIGEGALALHYSGNWSSAIFAGLAAGLTAGGAYSAFGKYLPVVGKAKPKTEKET